jgi:predicted Zn-dependent protease
MRRIIVAVALFLVASAGLPASAQRAEDEGVKLRRPAFTRYLVSADRLETAAGLQYAQLREQAARRGSLAPADDPQARRVQRIAQDLLQHADKWNPRAKDWKWEVSLVRSRTVNAACLPGGKILVFSGLLDGLALTDDEAAHVIGHEIAHALREHARTRAAKNTLTNAGAIAIAVLVGGGAGDLVRQGGGILALKFSRDDEREADLLGLELAARAGYDPAASVTLWEKMSKVARSGAPSWLSTHPSGQERIEHLRANLPLVARLYERARADKASAKPN